jgi:hypothetical protein
MKAHKNKTLGLSNLHKHELPNSTTYLPNILIILPKPPQVLVYWNTQQLNIIYEVTYTTSEQNRYFYEAFIGYWACS